MSGSTVSTVKVIKKDSLSERERDFVKNLCVKIESDIADMRRRFNSVETAWKDKLAYYDKLLKS